MNKEKNTNMDNEVWLEKIKARLAEHSEPLPDLGWERLERDLSASRIRHMSFYRKIAAVAAILIGALSLIGLRLTDGKAPMEKSSEQVVASVIDINVPPRYVEQEDVVVEKRLKPLAAQKDLFPSLLAITPKAQSILGKSELQDSISFHREDEKHSEQRVKAPKNTVLPEVENSLLAIADDSPRSHGKGWAVSFSVGNASGKLADDQNANGYQKLSSPGTNYVDLDLTAASNGVVIIPNGQDLVFQNGLPYLQARTHQIISIDHKQPISAGFSVRKNLSKGFSIETGLVYSYLASDVWYEGSTEEVSQKLHYLGIPLRANWNFLDRRNIALYVSAGGMVEKCVYGKIGTETTLVDPVQLSALAAVGAQYNFSRRVGIYVEPGVSYYFDDGSDIQTIRKEQPFCFTLQAGFRLNY